MVYDFDVAGVTSRSFFCHCLYELWFVALFSSFCL